MAEGLKFGRGTYQGAGKIGERDESFANRAAAIAPQNGWVYDTTRAEFAGRTTAGGNPDTYDRTYFWPLAITDRDYILTEGRTMAVSAGNESQRVALYVLDGRQLTRLPGSLLSTVASGLVKETLTTPVTIQAGKRYFAAGSITSGTGQFIIWRVGDPALEIPFLDVTVPPPTVDIFQLAKTNPERVPYALYLSKEAALVL